MKRILTLSVLIAMFALACNNQGTPKQEATDETTVEETVQKPNTLTAKELEDGWILMFNGQTPDGWRSYNGETFPEGGWEVVDGTLHVLGSGRGEAGGGGYSALK